MTEKKAEKTNGNVPAAEAEKPKNAEPEPPVLEVPANLKKMAKRMGIPLEEILTWAQTTDARITQIENGLQDLGVKLEPVVQLAARVQAAQAQQPVSAGNPSVGGYGISVGDVLKAVGMSGGGGDDEFTKKAKALALSSMEADISLTKAMKAAIFARKTTEIAKDVVG